jgi:anti-sigma B factor antagonist
MLLDIVQTDQRRTFRLIGELDISNAETLAAILDREAQEQGDINLDMSDLTFIDSSGIRVLLRAMDRLDGQGKLVLVAPTHPVRQILALMGLQDRDGLLVVGPGEEQPAR